MTNDEDMQGILDAQNHMLGRFEKTNEMLSNFNSLSSQRYNNVQQQFASHTQLLLDMKADLDAIFRRLRTLKAKLARDYPRAYAAAIKDEKRPDLGDEDDSASETNAGREIDRDVVEKVEPRGAEGENNEVSKDKNSGQDSASSKSTNGEPPVYIVD